MWLKQVSSCQVEEKFRAGDANEGCSWMWAHPLKTWRIPKSCPACEKKKAWSDEKIAKIRSLLKTLREDVDWRLRAGNDDDSTETTLLGTEPSEDKEDEQMSPVAQEKGFAKAFAGELIDDRADIAELTMVSEEPSPFV